jgi:hypothetical protein
LQSNNSIPLHAKDVVIVDDKEQKTMAITDDTVVMGIDIYNTKREGTVLDVKNDIWNPKWEPSYTQSIIRLPYLPGRGLPEFEANGSTTYVGAYASNGQTLWLRVNLLSGQVGGLTWLIKVYDANVASWTPLGSYTTFTANVKTDIYRQDGTVFMSNIDDANNGVPYTAVINQYIYLKITVTAAGNGQFAVFYTE